ncbi:MAG: hypothetical protein WCA99_13630, partial [Candidatus Sulfotelmatobacter sp.]
VLQIWPGGGGDWGTLEHGLSDWMMGKGQMVREKWEMRTPVVGLGPGSETEAAVHTRLNFGV